MTSSDLRPLSNDGRSNPGVAFVTRETSTCNPYTRLRPDCLGLYGQANKRTRWMPRRQEAMKDVVACDKPRGAGKLALIRGFPNGETHRFGGIPA